MVKQCIKCSEIKNIDLFLKDKSRKDGYRTICKICYNKWCREKYVKIGTIRIHDANSYCKSHNIKFKKYGDLLYKKPLQTKEERLAKRRKYEKSDINTRLATRLRSRLKKVLKRYKDNDTRTRYSENVGCTGKELISHIESTWYDHPKLNIKMDWNNYGFGYGKWTIDHIRPIIHYIRSGEDLRLSNHYSNLRAMWFEENIVKSIEDRKK